MSKSTVQTLLLEATKFLQAKGIPNPRYEARLLLELASQIPILDQIKNPDHPLEDGALDAFNTLLDQRLAGTPVSRLKGVREFWSLPFKISPATLDPRPDSEILIEVALSHFTSDACPLVLDLGTGSGCLLLSFLTERPKAHGIGLDFSLDALKVARENAVSLDLIDRAHFVAMDWTSGLKGAFDLILSNPPYIPEDEIETLSLEVKHHDPRTALTPGGDGLDAYRQLAPQIKTLLKPKGLCIVEIGQGQHQDVEDIFISAGLQILSWHKDLAGILRCGLFSA